MSLADLWRACIQEKRAAEATGETYTGADSVGVSTRMGLIATGARLADDGTLPELDAASMAPGVAPLLEGAADAVTWVFWGDRAPPRLPVLEAVVNMTDLPPMLMLRGVRVHASARGTGVFRRFVHALVATAAQAGVRAAVHEWDVVDDRMRDLLHKHA